MQQDTYLNLSSSDSHQKKSGSVDRRPGVGCWTRSLSRERSLVAPCRRALGLPSFSVLNIKNKNIFFLLPCALHPLFPLFPLFPQPRGTGPASVCPQRCSQQSSLFWRYNGKDLSALPIHHERPEPLHHIWSLKADTSVWIWYPRFCWFVSLLHNSRTYTLSRKLCENFLLNGAIDILKNDLLIFFFYFHWK